MSDPEVTADLVRLCDQLIALHNIIADQRRDMALIELRLAAIEKREACKCNENVDRWRDVLRICEEGGDQADE